MKIELRTWPGVAEIDAAAWDAVAHDAPPFLEHSFLAGLELTGCVGDANGWMPAPITAHLDGELVGAAAAYVKSHSMGEFVYDWAWADAAQRFGTSYYPKLVIAAPFSPVGGERLMVRPDLGVAERDEVKAALLKMAVRVARQAGCAGVHVLFCTDDERRLAQQLGFAHRLGTQLHWTNEGYATFDDFLARFRSKRRNQIRRERRRVRDEGVEVAAFSGDEILDAHRAPAFRFYLATIDRFSWGRQYLTEGFFEWLWERQRHRLQLVIASRGGEPVAGTVNLEKAGRRYGRYWGCDKDIHSLHFEVCSYAQIEDCIRRGVTAFEAGAGGYFHKFSRGFLPAYTHSGHLLFEPAFHGAIADFCAREATAIRAEAEGVRDTLFVR